MTPSAKLLAITQPLHYVAAEHDLDDGWFELYMPKNEGLDKPLDLIEYAGRWDYGAGSVAKMTGEPEKIIKRWLESGEESMIEMVDATFLIECSRVVTHELVRHRLVSYQQESQRFVSYKDEKAEDLFYCPPELSEYAQDAFWEAVSIALDDYHELVEKHLVPKQIARYVLPNATRTRIIAKTNLREWRHILRLRLHKSAQPEMRLVMRQVFDQLQEQFGNVLFPDDIAEERSAR
jgi:thymidylate synthase (FAD)